MSEVCEKATADHPVDEWFPMPSLAGWYEVRQEGKQATEIVLVRDIHLKNETKSIVFYPMREGVFLPFQDLDSLAGENLLWRGPHRQFERPLMG